MKRDDFLHVDTNLGKLEVAVIIIGGGHSQKLVRPYRLCDL